MIEHYYEYLDAHNILINLPVHYFQNIINFESFGHFCEFNTFIEVNNDLLENHCCNSEIILVE